jgi:nucleoside recognition membrane protein YjiH
MPLHSAGIAILSVFALIIYTSQCNNETTYSTKSEHMRAVIVHAQLIGFMIAVLSPLQSSRVSPCMQERFQSALQSLSRSEIH